MRDKEQILDEIYRLRSDLRVGDVVGMTRRTRQQMDRFIDALNAVISYLNTDEHPTEQISAATPEVMNLFAKYVADNMRPQGQWIVYGRQGGIPITDCCSNCKYEMKWYRNKYNFCPNCGAQMGGTDNGK